MRPTDAPALVQSLSGLAEVYGARAVSDKAAKVWLDVLREFPIERVCSLLSGWPKANARMPVPKDVWTVLNDERTEDIERRNAAEKAQEKREIRRLGDPRIKDANLARMRQMLAAVQGRGMPTGPDLARRMLDDAAEGKVLGIVQRAFIKHNLGWTEAQMDEAVEAGQAHAAEHGLLPWRPRHVRALEKLDRREREPA